LPSNNLQNFLAHWPWASYRYAVIIIIVIMIMIMIMIMIRLTSLERMRYLTKRPLNTASVCESNSLAGVTVVVPAENKSERVITT